METILRDLRFAVRGIARHPAFSFVAVFCLALGIGATTAIFSFVDALLLRAAPFPEAGKVVVVYGNFVRDDIRIPLSGYEFLDLRAQARSFHKAAAGIELTMSMTGDGEPVLVHAARVSADLFDLLGVPPELGRAFTPEEDRFGQNRVAILSNPFWQRRFSGDPKVIGKTVELDGAPFEIVGVMPAEFRTFGGGQDLWIPIAMNLGALPPREARGLSIFARLAPGATLESAGNEMDVIASRFVRAYPSSYPQDGGYRLVLVPIREVYVGGFEPMFLFLSVAVSLVLLVACANVASLLLARALGRDREMAVRAALGAGRRAIVRQLLVESTVLSLLGGALGVLFAVWGLHALHAGLPPESFPLLGRVAFSGRALAFGLLAAVVTGLLFGLAPALRAFRTDVAGSLKEGSKGSEGAGRQPLRAGLVVAEVALSLVVLAAAGLLGRSLGRLAAVDPGFQPKGVLSALILPRSLADQPRRLVNFYRALEARLRALPGATAVGLVSQLPLGGDDIVASVRAIGGDPTAPPTYASYRAATPGYFAALGIPLLKGRTFTDAEGVEGSRVAVVDELLARGFWGEQNPLGRTFYDESNGPGSPLEVIGVVGSIHHDSLRKKPQAAYYVPFASTAIPLAYVVVRTGGDPAQLAGPLREAVAELDRNLPLDDLKTMPERVRGSMVRARLAATLASIFGAVSLVLTLIGVYGLIAFAVASRRREFGIRMALGETQGGVVALVLRRSLALVGLGVGAGLVLSLLAAQLAAAKFAQLLFGVSAFDAASFAGACLALLGAGFLASAIPALRSTRTPPSAALRTE
ncbi:MAG TPA: ABC transporter permease [Thermoanaerobaculia bacterium]|nr:ABC transporter permease [Thermoanaerobaculia bacterium]